MLSKIAGLMKSEMTKAAALFVGAQSKFLSLLEAYKEKVPGDAVAEARGPRSTAEESPAGSRRAARPPRKRPRPRPKRRRRH